MKTVPLSELATINPRSPRVDRDSEVAFVGMAHLNARTAETESPSIRTFAEVSKGYTIFQDGDILVAKITPCYENNKIGQARLPCRVGVGSTEFHVVRPHDDLDDQYLLHFLRQDHIRRQGQLRMTGSAGQRRVPVDFLQTLAVPLPAIGEQRRIAMMLDQASSLRSRHREVYNSLTSLRSSIFIDMFGDPIRNERSWAKADLGHLGQWHSGATPPRGKLQYFVGDVSWYSSGELGPIFTAGSNERVSSAAFKETSLKRVPAGALMLGMYDTAAFKSSIASEDCACNQAIAFSSIDPKLADTIYVYFAIQLASERLRQLQRGIRQKNLNLSIVRQIQIPIPPVDLQQDFARRLEAVGAVASNANRLGEEADVLFASLQARAFSGRL